MAATPSEASEGPVLQLINKRLRALKKKQTRIAQMEASLSQGKPLNKEQQQTLLSKPSLLGAIEELHKLLLLLPHQPFSPETPPEPLPEYPPETLPETLPGKPPETVPERRTETLPETVPEMVPETLPEMVPEGGMELGVVEDLVKLVYFGSMFDVKSGSEFVGMMYRKSHERGCCLSYDYVTEEEEEGGLLVEGDLDFIARLGGMMVSRPLDSGLSHREALERCVEHAKMWVEKSENPIAPDSDVTYATLREKLNKIMASDYFTTTPEMKASVEMVAAAENYKSFHVPLNLSVVSVESEDSTMKHERKEQDENFKKHEFSNGQLGHVEELHKDASQVQNSIEVHVEVESDQQSNEMQNSHEQEYKEQVTAPRRHHRGGRGGGYTGYQNGRGGRGGRGRGGYQNGHIENYEQADKYYPRYNNNFRGRGGRGGAGGYYNHNAEGGRVPVNS